MANNKNNFLIPKDKAEERKTWIKCSACGKKLAEYSSYRLKGHQIHIVEVKVGRDPDNNPLSCIEIYGPAMIKCWGNEYGTRHRCENWELVTPLPIKNVPMQHMSRSVQSGEVV
jgi:hypothetical protein